MGSNRELRFRDPHGRELKDVPIRHVGPRLGWPTIFAGNAELGITAETPACGFFRVIRSTTPPVSMRSCELTSEATDVRSH
jgi:hypothetical protein